MNAREAVARLEAFRSGKPLPSGDTLHFPIVDDRELLMLAFVRMGGESGPWAIGYGKPGKKPHLLCVPEPRNRDLTAAMVAEFAPTLLEHLRHPDHAADAPARPDHGLAPRQIWLPNEGHIEMLHHLAYSYTFTKWGDPARAKLLNQLGRASTWLFNEAHRPGQKFVMAANAALTESFTFPCETVRQGHLGYLLAWLETTGRRDARMAAATLAEQQSVSTNLEPALERDMLGDAVEEWNEAHGNNGDTARAEKTIRRLLEAELVRRLELVERAITLLRADRRPVNPGAAQLSAASESEHWYQYLRLELNVNDEQDGPAFTPSPETDRYPAAAASRFFVHEDSDELQEGLLIHHDAELRAQAVAQGSAIEGTIIQVVDETAGAKKTTPVWTIEGSGLGPLQLREGTKVCLADVPKREGVIRQITSVRGGKRRYELEITGWKTEQRLPGRRVIPHAADQALVDKEVLLLKATASGIARRKSQKVWNHQVPGAWLTHQMPSGAHADLPTDVGEDMQRIQRALEDES